MKPYLLKALGAYCVAAVAIGIASTFVAILPLIVLALMVRYGRKGFAIVKRAILKAASYLYGRRRLYAHRAYGVLILVIYPFAFLYYAVKDALPNVRYDMRDVRDLFTGRYAM